MYLGALFEILTLIAGIGMAVTLFPVLRRQSESLALGYVTVRVVESCLIAVGIVSLLAVVTLRQDLAGAPAPTTRRSSSPAGRWSPSMTRRSCSARRSARPSATG